MEIYYEDAYIKELETKIKEKGKEGDLFFVIPERNLFYLGGGGQPEDYGYVNDLKILKMEKRGFEIFYFLEKLPVGENVILKVDFERRYSFMQHHTAQHLITAIADKYYNLKTISFHLSEDYGLIDFSGFYNEEILNEIEEKANEKIRKSINLNFNFYKMEEIEKMDIRSRGLPENFEGLVRVVEIEGEDKNTCGGLHIKNTSEIQMIKFINFEKIKEGIRLYYKAGNKLLEFLNEKLQLEENIKKILNCSPDDFINVLNSWEREKILTKKNLKKIKESFLSFLKEDEKNFYIFLGADMEFLQKIGKFLSSKYDAKTIILIGEDGENFYFSIVQGENSNIPANNFFEKIIELTGARGGGREKNFQGKGQLGPSFDKLINFLKT